MKFADDSVIASLLEEEETGHSPVVDDFVAWCDAAFSQMNVTKTKEMSTDFRRKPQAPINTTIKGQVVESVEPCEYLGTVTDSKYCLSYVRRVNNTCFA